MASAAPVSQSPRPSAAPQVLGHKRQRRDMAPTDTYAALGQSMEHAMLTGNRDGQYRLTYVQGCACTVALAGGMCCPGSAVSSATQGVSAGHMAGHAGMLPLQIFSGLASAVGMYGGARTLINSVRALLNLGATRRTYAQQEEALALSCDDAAHTQRLPRTLARQRGQRDALRGTQEQIKRAQGEQWFNIAVPGAVQFLASTTSALAFLNGVAKGFLGALGGTVVGSAAGSLFSAYGFGMATKHFVDYGRARRVPKLTCCQSDDGNYRDAFNTYLKERKTHALLTGLAWTSVGVAGVVGTLVAVGALAFPAAWGVVLAIGGAAALWAMWQNSRSRFAAHVPVSSHADPELLADTTTYAADGCRSPEARRQARLKRDTTQRAFVWRTLDQQRAGMDQATHTMLQLQSRRVKVRRRLEDIFSAKCGPGANNVLPRAVSQTPAGEQRTVFERAQLDGALTFVRTERALLQGRFAGEQSNLQARRAEVAAALKNNDLTPLVAATLRSTREALRDDRARLHAGQQRLATLSALADVLEGLKDHAGSLRREPEAESTPEQRLWTQARVVLMQLQGTLGDAISQRMIKQDLKRPGTERIFSQLPEGKRVLPLANVHVRAHKVDAFVAAITPDLDRAFLHAFFNTHRLPAELDYIMEREMADRRPGRAAALRDGDAQATLASPQAACCR